MFEFVNRWFSRKKTGSVQPEYKYSKHIAENTDGSVTISAQQSDDSVSSKTELKNERKVSCSTCGKMVLEWKARLNRGQCYACRSESVLQDSASSKAELEKGKTVPCSKCGRLMYESSSRRHKGLCVDCRKIKDVTKPKDVIKIFGTSYESTMTLDEFNKRHIGSSNNLEPSEYRRQGNKNICEICGKTMVQNISGHYWCDRCGLSNDPDNVNSLVNRIRYPKMSNEAVEKLWNMSLNPAPKESHLSYAIRCLRDEIEHHVYYPSSESAINALFHLRNARPDRQRDFEIWVMLAWCHSDDKLAQYGYELIDIYSKEGTFMRSAKDLTRGVGLRIYEMHGMQKMQEIASAIKVLFGVNAMSELNSAWKGIADGTISTTSASVLSSPEQTKSSYAPNKEAISSTSKQQISKEIQQAQTMVAKNCWPGALWWSAKALENNPGANKDLFIKALEQTRILWATLCNEHNKKTRQYVLLLERGNMSPEETQLVTNWVVSAFYLDDIQDEHASLSKRFTNGELEQATKLLESDLESARHLSLDLIDGVFTGQKASIGWKIASPGEKDFESAFTKERRAVEITLQVNSASDWRNACEKLNNLFEQTERAKELKLMEVQQCQDSEVKQYKVEYTTNFAKHAAMFLKTRNRLRELQ